jgi:drug/metabolite transporter (DMT)-like permease
MELAQECPETPADAPDQRKRPPMGDEAPENTGRPYVWMLGGCLFFTLMSACTHALRTSCDWQVIALVRSLMALVLAVLLTLSAGEKLVFWRPRTLWLRSVAGSVSQVSTFYALTHLPVSDVLTLTNMFPIWVALLSWPLLGESPPRIVWLSVFSGVAGVVLIQQPHIADGNFAALIALMGSFFTAVAMLGLHRLQGIAPAAIVAHFSVVSSVFCVVSFFVFERTVASSGTAEGRNLLLLGGVGITATIGQLFLTKAFSRGSPAKVSVVGLTQVVMAMVLDVALFDISFSLDTLVGIALIVVPTAWLLLRQGA